MAATATAVQGRVPEFFSSSCTHCSIENEAPRSTEANIRIECHSCSKVYNASIPSIKPAKSTSNSGSSSNGTRSGSGSGSGSGSSRKVGTDEEPLNTTLYDLLGVSPAATPAEIKRRYYVLALKYHPDKNAGNPEAEEMFKQVSDAYQIMSDPAKRKRYNQIGDEMLKPENGNGAGEVNPGEFFSQLFGGGRFDGLIGDVMVVKEMNDAYNEGEAAAAASGNEGETSDGYVKVELTAEEKAEKEEKEKIKTAEREQEMKQRIQELTAKLLERLEPYVAADGIPAAEEILRMKTENEASELKDENFGYELLQTIGYIYKFKASKYLERHERFGGIKGFVTGMREVGHIFSEAYSAVKSARQMQSMWQEIERLDKEGQLDADQRREMEERAGRMAIEAIWKTGRMEIQNLLREVCDNVLGQQEKDRQKRILRANALRIVGDVFMSIKAPADHVNPFLSPPPSA
ncbi:DnaJ-domain-containing protein [Ramicandelaber brevisporus]|nr:DnaJ-domain-containing protein [Ramicandelaber brevisporus]